MADGFNRCDEYIFLANLQHFLTGSMALYFGGWRVYPQILKGQFEVLSLGKNNVQLPGALAQSDFGWNRCGWFHVSLFWRELFTRIA
jgi:hypothetical protein